MTKTHRAIFWLFAIWVAGLLVEMARAQTNTTGIQIRVETQAPAVVPLKIQLLALINGTLYLVDTPASFIQPAGGRLTIVPPSGTSINEQAEEPPRLTAVMPTFTLAADPLGGIVRVYRNGLRLRRGEDFANAGRAVTFLANALPQPGDLMTFEYLR